MIKTMKLTDVADIDNRPQAGKIYPSGTIIIQISATRGQILYLQKPREIESHYAVINPKYTEPFYLFAVIEKFFPKFFQQRRQGLNFRAEELQYFELPIHQDRQTQELIGRTMKVLGNDREKFYS